MVSAAGKAEGVSESIQGRRPQPQDAPSTTRRSQVNTTGSPDITAGSMSTIPRPVGTNAGSIITTPGSMSQPKENMNTVLIFGPGVEKAKGAKKSIGGGGAKAGARAGNAYRIL